MSSPDFRKAMSWCSLAATLFSAAALALEGAPPSGGLDVADLELDDLLRGEVVTTAAKRVQLSNSSLSTVSVITREEIDASPVLFLGELLAQVPGLDVRWGKMQRLYVGARGLGGTALSSRMLLLWDGLPMNDPLTGDLNAGHFIPLVDVERIEVIRGAGSTMYGSNAFNGVINVITRAGSQSSETATTTRARALFGSFTTSRLQASHDQSVGELRLGASVEALRSNGPLPVAERYSGSNLERLKNDDVEHTSVSARAAYKGFRITGNYTAGDRGRPGEYRTDSKGNILPCTTCHSYGSANGRGLKYAGSPNSCGSCHYTPHDRETLDRGSVAAFYDLRLSDNLSVQARAHHTEYRTHYEIFREAEFLSLPAAEHIFVSQRASGAEVNVNHTMGEFNTLLAGLEVRRFEVASEVLNTDTGAITEGQVGAYVEDELRPLHWLSITGGARSDWSGYGVALSPRAGVVATLMEGLLLKGAVGRAYRNPSISERKVMSKERNMVAGNPFLKPEWLTSAEAGVTYSRAVGEDLALRFSGVGFYTDARDLVGFRTFGDSLPAFYNIDRVLTMGAELELSAELRGPRLKGSASYVFQDQRAAAGTALPYAPKSKANLTVQGTTDRLSYLVRARFIGDRLDDSGVKLPSFAVMDASLGYEVWKGLSAQLWATNLTDDEHQESIGTPGARRAVYLMVGYQH